MEIIEIFQIEPVYKAFIAAALGATIGLERELAGKDPSLRTFSLICLGSCMFALLSIQATVGYPNADPGRISSQLVTGIGFLGAGAIFKSRNGVAGLTTAALIWVTAAIGMSVGMDRMDLALAGTLAVFIILVVLNLLHQLIRKVRGQEYNKHLH